jgi:hypothetical protein
MIKGSTISKIKFNWIVAYRFNDELKEVGLETYQEALKLYMELRIRGYDPSLHGVGE